MTQLYVGNLSEDGDEKAIRSLFGRYGVVREVLMKNGYAFVEMDNALQAEQAMRDLNGEPRECCERELWCSGGADCACCKYVCALHG